jgi:hypothetical protein
MESYHLALYEGGSTSHLEAENRSCTDVEHELLTRSIIDKEPRLSELVLGRVTSGPSARSGD